MIKSYKDLLPRQKAMDLVELVYELTRGFPRQELFGLAASLRGAAVSIPAKIADDHERDNSREFIHYGKIVNGLMNSIERYAVAHGR